MNAISETLPPLSETEVEQLCIVDQVDGDPKLLLLGKVDLDEYLTKLRPLVEVDEGDIGTKAGRDAIVSRAASVRSRKATFEKTKLGLTEHWRKQTADVNAKGKVIAEKMGALAEEIRKPVTEWEAAEEARKDEANQILQDLESAAVITFGMTSEIVQARLDRIRGINLNADILGVRIDMATELRDDAVAKLTEAVASLKAQEAQAAELDRLRAEQERARIAAEQAEQERIAKERAEAAQKAETERMERAKAEAAEQARREAEQRAEQERIERDRAAQAEIDAANARAAQAEADAKAERDRITYAETVRKQAEEAEAAQKAKREADIAHRAEVIQTAADALIGIPGMTQKMAKSVLHEIAAGTVPAVRITF